MTSFQDHYDAGVRFDADIPVYPVYRLLDDAAAKFPRGIAMDFLGKKFTWGECAEIATCIAANLQAADIKKGDRIGLMLPNTPFYLVFYHAVLKAGATVVNINPLYAPAELERIAQDCGMEAIVTLDLCALYDKAKALQDKKMVGSVIVCRFTDVLPFPQNLLFPVFKFNQISSRAHAGQDVLLDDLLHPDAPWTDPQLDVQNDIAVFQYTGGTTGVPKAAMLTHANVTANVEQCRAWFPTAKEGREVMLGVLPFFHVFSMTAVLNLCTRLGMRMIATPRFDLKQTLKLVQKHRPNFFPTVPAILNAMLHAQGRAKYDLSSLQYCISGGAPLPVEVKTRFERETGARVVEGYGLSETSPVVCVNPLDGDNKAGSIGLPVPQTQIALLSIEDHTTFLTGADARGELCVKGPQVMAGYWNNQAETDAVFLDGWLRTGDVATIDADGYVFIVDRIKDMIISNGYKIYPRQVEEALYKHPAVEECIVAGVADDERGEVPKAWIKCKDGQTLDADTLRTFLKGHLSPLEIPRVYEFRTEPLPKTLIGKLSRKDVQAEG